MLDFLKFCAKNRAFSGARLVLKIVLFGLLELAKKNVKSEIGVFLPCRKADFFVVFLRNPRNSEANLGLRVSQLWSLGLPIVLSGGPSRGVHVVVFWVSQLWFSGLPISKVIQDLHTHSELEKIHKACAAPPSFACVLGAITSLQKMWGHYESPEDVFPNRPHPPPGITRSNNLKSNAIMLRES